MNTKSIFQRAVFTSITIALILTFTIGKVNNTNVLDLFDGVLNTEASSGNISPSHVCSTNQYQQFTDTSTANNILLSTPLDTDVSFSLPMVQNSFSPSLQPTETVNNLCIQTLPNFGNLYIGSFPFNPSPINGFTGNTDYSFYPQIGSYRPPAGFIGLACFDYFVEYSSPTILAFTGNRAYNTNVAQMRIQVGGSTRTTCGADGSPTQSGTINGKIYKKTISYGGYFYTGPQLYYNSDYNTTWNPLPPGTTITITELSNPVNSFVLIPNFDGTYSQNVPPGQYSVTVNVNSTYKVATSTDLGDPGNTGSNPTIVTIASGQIKSAGTDGIFLRKERAGLIYPDYNNNGFQDNDEVYSISNPIPSGIIVKLTCVFPALFTMVQYPVLDADGSYAQQIAPEYDNTCTTLVTAPTGYIVTQSTETGDGVGSNPTVQTYTNPPNSISQGKDGLYQIPTTGTITGKIYPDLNNNGFEDANESDYSTTSPSPVNTVRITNTTTSAFFDTVVNLDGTYSQVVPAGDYSITVIAPALYSISNSIELGNGQGSNPTILTVVAGDNKNAGKDGLFLPTSNITGKIYPDLNNNGIQDTNEPDFSSTNPFPIDTMISINYCAGDIIGSPIINVDGTYSFIPFYYNVGEPICVIVYASTGYSISNSQENGDGVDSNPTSITMTSLVNQTIYAGKDGLYQTPTTGTITGKLYNVLSADSIQGADEPDYNSTNNIIPTGTLITLADVNNINNTVTISPNFDGTYSQQLPPGQYAVTISTSIYYQITNSIELGDLNNSGSNPTIVTISGGETKSAGKDGLSLHSIQSITGKIYPDLNNNGTQDTFEPDYNSTTNTIPQNTTISIVNTFDSTESYTLVPNPDGTYFQSFPGFYYTVTVITSSGYTVSSNSQFGETNPTPYVFDNATSSYSLDGLYQIPTTGTITGKIYPDLNNNGFQDINELDYSAPNPSPVNTVRITNITTSAFFDTVVNFDGTYSQVVPTGDYSITVNAAALYIISNSIELDDGVGANPTVVTVAAGETKSAGKDGLHRALGRITGSIYYDNNRNGIQDTGESTVFDNQASIIVTNITDPQNVGTPFQGFIYNYSNFNEYVITVDPGTYSITIVDNNGYTITNSIENGDGVGSNPTIVTVGGNETKSAGKDGFNTTSPTACGDTSNLQFFFLDLLGSIRASAQTAECATITGSIYQDINNNANQDSSEPNFSTSSPIIPGTTVNISSQTNANLSFVTAINPDGSYLQQVPPGSYNVTISAPSSYLISSPNQVLGMNTKTTTLQIVAGETKSAGKEGLFNGVIPPQTSLNTGGAISIQTNQLQSSSAAVSKPSELKVSKSLSTLAIDRKFDLNDPYVCGGYIYGNVISSPNVIADLNIEFSQEGKIVKTYSLKSNTDGTWKQLLDDLAYGKYSYKVVASYQELTDTESFEIQHKSLEECQNVDELGNVSAIRVSKDFQDIVLARTGGSSVRFNSPFVTFALILVLAFVVSIFRNLNYLKALFFYSFLFVSYLYTK
jgi:large repetitive protein